jgi:hypothetical protein
MSVERYKSLVESSRRVLGARKIEIPRFAGFGYRPGGTWTATVFVAPHWFFAVVAGALAVGFKQKPRWRFSLSYLFVLMTVAVLFVAGIAAAVRLL